MRPGQSESIQVLLASGDAGRYAHSSDKSAIYYEISDSVDSYHQEIGRAGRDGEKVEAFIFFRDEDIGARAFKTGEGRLNQQQVELLAAAIAC